MPKIFVRSAYNYDTMQASDESGLKCEDVSLTQQHQKDDADINVIVRRFGLTGELPSDFRIPQYGDFTGVSDYRSAIHAVRAAEDQFMELPGEIRSRFGHDPQAFLEFCTDPKNIDELIKMGLAVKKEVAAEPATPATQASSADAKPADGK